MKTKHCKMCKEDKTVDQFYKHAQHAGSYTAYCKPCQADYTRARKYNVDPETFQNMILDQNGKCAICSVDFDSTRWGSPRVDHDHETGKVRALLCHHCNLGLGHLGDSLLKLSLAVTYLVRHK